MSTRAWRKIKGADDANEEDAENDSPEEPVSKPTVFSCDLLDDLIDDDEPEVPQTPEPSQDIQSAEKPKPASKSKKKKKKPKPAEGARKKQDDDDLKFLEEQVELNKLNQSISQNQKQSSKSSTKSYLSIDARFLLADNEMKRMFGSDVFRNMNKQRRAHRGHGKAQPFKLAKWPPESPVHLSNTGLSMRLVETVDGGGKQVFKLDHSAQYQKVQFGFFAAVEAMQPEILMRLLDANPLHVDSLIQASNYLKMSEDTHTAGLLIERALCILESSFHPLFSLMNEKCLLPYKYPENRSLYLACFHHLYYLTKKGCHRTALEFCKLILSLSPEDDPLAVLMFIDCFALKAKEYQWLLNFYETWNPFKNLNRLPNFAFSIPLAEFLLKYGEAESNSEDADTKSLEDALISFPSVLREILDRCNIDADSTTERHSYFGMSADKYQLEILTHMCKLYCTRVSHLWKQPEVMAWLELATKRAIARVDRKDPLVQTSTTNRQTIYKGVPKNIYRHFLLSDVKDVSPALPRELQSQPVFLHDPLPPSDTVTSYERPPSMPRADFSSGSSNVLRLFFEALFPNYGMDQAILERAGGAIQMIPPVEVMEAAVAEAVGDLDNLPDGQPVANPQAAGGVDNNLLNRLRDMLRLRADDPQGAGDVFEVDIADEVHSDDDLLDDEDEWEPYDPDQFQ